MTENKPLPARWKGILREKLRELEESTGKVLEKALQPLTPKPENYNSDTDSYDMDYLEEGVYARPARSRRFKGLGRPAQKEPTK
jgi:hypothetical protein